MEQAKNFYRHAVARINPKYYALIGQVALLLSILFLFDLTRTWEQIVFAVLIAVAAELVLSRLTLRQGKFSAGECISSATVISLGGLVLVLSPYWWFYGFVSLVGVVSKYIFVNHEGRHIYNPVNFGIVFSVIVLPAFLNVWPDSFTTQISPILCILFFGTLLSVFTNRWRVVLGYFLGIFIIGLPGAFILDLPFLIILGPELNANVIIFILLVIADPQTSPKQAYHQWAFGFLVAGVNLLLRYEQFYYAPFIALFVVLSFGSLLFGASGLLVRKPK